MTLNELLPAVRLLPPLDKLRLIRILAQELDATETVFPLQHYKVYDMPTPYDTFGAGKELMKVLEQDSDDNN